MEIFHGGPGLSISIINRQARTYFQKNLKKYNLGPGQQAYLLALRPGEALPQEVLSERLQVDRANVTRAVKVLTGLGYFKREETPSDSRVRLISLTEKGMEVREEVRVIALQWIEKLKSRVTDDEWEVMEQALEKIARG